MAYPAELGSALFEWIEGFYTPRRHSGLGYLSPSEFENQHVTAAFAA